jgi:hypothetical protein
MDCKTAQNLLDYARPHAVDLAAEDVRALEDHLTLCPDCNAQAKHERRIDEHLSRAMKAVEVPDRLRNHLLAQLKAERGDMYRRRISSGLRYVAAVAACLLLAALSVFGWSQYRFANRPQPDLDSFVAQVIDNQRQHPDRAEVEKEFQQQHGVATVLPAFEYRYLTTYGMAKFQGALVPKLVFNCDNNEENAHAYVYVLSEKQFKLNKLTTPFQASTGYGYMVEVLHTPNSPYAYVIVHTGETYDWLKLKPQS